MLAYAQPSVLATSKQLVEVATVKAQLGIESDDTSRDSIISQLIDMASQAIATEIGREPWRQTYIERTWSQGGPFLIPINWPIETVDSVVVGLTNPVTVDEAQYEIGGSRLDRLWRSTCWAPSCPGELDYVLTYTAGWLMPGEEAIEGAFALPKDFELAALVTVADWASHAELPVGVQSETVDGASITYDTGFRGQRYAIPAGAARLLAGWR